MLVLVAGCGSGAADPPAKAGRSASAQASARPKPPARPAAKPLPAGQRALLAKEARAMYGAASGGAVPAFDRRRTAIVGMGDSEMSGEGIGDYTPSTDRPSDECHRSPASLIDRTGARVDTAVNLACSGAASADVRAGGDAQYADQPAQADQLAVQARLTRVTAVAVLVGANDLDYGEVMADCVTRRLRLGRPCAKTYGPGWGDRVSGAMTRVRGAVGSIREVMRDAGYREADYRLVLMSYPSPLGPGTGGKGLGCLAYPSDGRWARDTAVPALARGLRAVAGETGAGFLDLKGLFDGHEACSPAPWVRGLQLDLGAGKNAVAGSFHPNAAGHGVMGQCLGAFLHGGRATAVCTANGVSVRLGPA
ncbi:hypothetical protein BIV57_03420 [Mangrovactinospora gilvigrisea]|uniref:SGNH hydrolase-type esterase domain-containing protein n=1 Tax=Mangrovactinospora gilvigrisea TaxID=1428644 RepID=A0A1J7BJP1_9ACTN|nr:hypothetical protein BIV57_03420 [Mangrovactinospora gilvigrisea]